MLNLSNFNSALYLCPYVTTLFGAIYIYMRLNFYSTKNFLTKLESASTEGNLRNYNPIVNFLTLLTLLILVVTGANNLVNVSFNYTPMTLLLLLSYSYVISSGNIRNGHWIFGSFFSVLFALLLLSNESIFNFFFLLEINTYLFLYLGVCQVQKVNTYQSKSVVNAVLVAFIINFFSSIALFASITYLVYLNGPEIYFCDGLASDVFLLFFILKILSGPWVYFGVEVYKGFKYLTLLIYTLIFLLILAPKLFFFATSFTVSIGVGLYIPLIFYAGLVLIGTRNINSIKIFLAYSTSYNFIYVFIFYAITNYNVI